MEEELVKRIVFRLCWRCERGEGVTREQYPNEYVEWVHSVDTYLSNGVEVTIPCEPCAASAVREEVYMFNKERGVVGG